GRKPFPMRSHGHHRACVRERALGTSTLRLRETSTPIRLPNGGKTSTAAAIAAAAEGKGSVRKNPLLATRARFASSWPVFRVPWRRSHQEDVRTAGLLKLDSVRLAERQFPFSISKRSAATSFSSAPVTCETSGDDARRSAFGGQHHFASWEMVK